ncbi:MAG: carbamoyl-phosphate synthase large subunit [Aquificae bacterium]|nr:carbamoyl-phosphate synthase large subunit [Aquificota bacterium]
MPKRTDINKILLIGSGPIVIGQAAEFDYSGTQGAKALKEEGYEVILINSNPATIMTDPEIADRTYIEPLITPVVEKIIEKERPDAILPTLGGQTALNLAVDLYEKGILEKYNVKMIGASYEAIKKAEDRELFKDAMEKIGLLMPKSAVVRSIPQAYEAIDWIGFPVIIRPSFTLGGTGGSIAYNQDEFHEKVKAGLEASPIHEVLLEESVIGWKEFEMEVMRDKNDNCVIVCSIENFDPMGVHTGDSITVAPAMTLSDREYQILRDYSIAVLKEIGIETGGSNVQFAQNPNNGTFYVIEMNPRVSRSSALASKATGFPIAKIAAKLAVGYTLDELKNDITKETPASFEPTIDYIVTKIPRFDFAKFPQTDITLTTMMKSVGEVMAIGRTFKESLQKAVRSLELGRYGFYIGLEKYDDDDIKKRIITPNADRLWYIAEGFRRGWSIEDIHELSHIDRWFLNELKQIVDFEQHLSRYSLDTVPQEELEKAKQWGFSDRELARLLKTTESKIRQKRIPTSYKLVDTCSAEFEAYTPYYYSSYESLSGKIEPDGSIRYFRDTEL